MRGELLAAGEESARMNLVRDGSQSRRSRIGGPGSGVVEVLALRQLLASRGVRRVDLLLIDAERAELPILRGFPWGDVPVAMVLCDLHPYAWKDFGYDGEAMAGFLREWGMRCVDAYLRELSPFSDEGYLGPTLLLGGSAAENRP